jgi:hypothetical protein
VPSLLEGRASHYPLIPTTYGSEVQHHVRGSTARLDCRRRPRLVHFSPAGEPTYTSPAHQRVLPVASLRRDLSGSTVARDDRRDVLRRVDKDSFFVGCKGNEVPDGLAGIVGDHGLNLRCHTRCSYRSRILPKMFIDHLSRTEDS